MLQPGQPAPSFALPDADMQTVSLQAFRGKKHVVIYFYPRDGTPGCTIVTTDFSDHEDQFGKFDCVVLGVSRDDCLTHADFRDKHGVTIALLSDPEGEVCRKYGVLQEKQSEDGARRECLIRSTFVIDKRSEEHTSELQSLAYLVCRLLLEKKKNPSCQHSRPYRTTYATETNVH